MVISTGTLLYFDHPQEPEPDEVRGRPVLGHALRRRQDGFRLHSRRIVQQRQVILSLGFFSTEDLDNNIRDTFVPLARPETLTGMQAQLWSELILDVSVAHLQLYPHLIAFAERACTKPTGKWRKVGRRNITVSTTRKNSRMWLDARVGEVEK